MLDFGYTVRKRDSTTEEYTRDKIISALNIAFKNTNTLNNSVIFMIEDIETEIKNTQDYKNSSIIDIEDIQNIVEKILMTYKYYEAARHYITHRVMRTEARKNETYVSKINEDITPPWGPLGYVTYKRTYARRLNDDTDRTEEFNDTILRVLDACQKQLKVGFTNQEIRDAYKYFMNLKCSVAGRFLWQLGTKTVDLLGLMSLQNCAFTNINEPIRPFLWIFDVLMLGTGVGFNIQRYNVDKLPPLLDYPISITRLDTKDADFIIPDSREGWVSLLEKTLESYFYKGKSFTYSTILIRSRGQRINGFGGMASGPEALVELISTIQKILNKRLGQKLTSVDCLDIINIIATCVVAGNTRRSALIAIGDPDDFDYLRAKRWDLGGIPNWRCMSNNSVNCSSIDDLPEDFWEGYRGNGEPYGLVNMELCRKTGRLKDFGKYPDPDVEGFNPCLTGDTVILTSNGLMKINELIGKKFVAVVDGREYPSTEEGFWCSGNKEVYEVKLHNGLKVKATENHKFMTSSGWKRIDELSIGDYISLPNNDGYKWSGGIGDEIEGYIIGNIIGDGTFNKNKPVITVWINEDIDCYEPAKLIEEYIRTNYSHMEDFKGFNLARKNNGIKEYRLKSAGLTAIVNKFKLTGDKKIIENGSYDFTIGLLRGLFDTYGKVITNIHKSREIRLNQSNLELLESVQKMLLAIGIQSKVYENRRSEYKRYLQDGKYGEKLYICKNNHELILSDVDVFKFSYLIGFYNPEKASKVQFIINSYINNPSIKHYLSKIVSISKLENTQFVYDCTIPDVHCFSANGMLSHNCAEQNLVHGETCCLSEIYLPNINSFEELIGVSTTLYKICKHSLLMQCHQKNTEDIVHRNMRMGIGVTGYLQCEQNKKDWLSPLYEYLREFDKDYSAKLGCPVSIKLTTCKPSGTLSILPGVTPGCHPGIYQHFIRRIRIGSDNPLISLCKSHGYKVEYQRNFDGTEDRNTMVVEFPCKYPDGTRLAKDMTAIDQLEVVKELQTNWSDNAVSCTVYYRLNELDSIKEWLRNNFTNSVKSCSFLLHSDHGFDQAPYEDITPEVYNELMGLTIPITAGHIQQADDDQMEVCKGGACPLR